MIKRRHEVALYTFANHAPDWLEIVHQNLKSEPWGQDNKVLELYLRANFEIAKQQQKVVENEEKGYAIWRAGYLITPSMDPVWMYYEKNDPHYTQKWNFAGVKIGEAPMEGINESQYSVTYTPPEFNPKWDIYIDPRNFTHILEHNHDRLAGVLGVDVADNPHRLFRTLYGEVMLERKEAAGVIPQWYMGGYNFLMPISLTEPNKVDLTAALTIDETMKRYQLRTLLLPHYAYANARAIVKSRTQFASWAMLDDKTLDAVDYEEQNEDE
jgi:hypothetical protein